MGVIFTDRTRDTSSAQSSSTITLAGSPPTGFQSFNDGIGDGNPVVYCITDGTNWEVNLGVYTDATKTLGRNTTPISSSNGGAQVASFSGTVDVFCTNPAADALGKEFTQGPVVGNYTTACVDTTGANGLNSVYMTFTPVLIREWFTTATLGLWVTTLSTESGATFDLALYSSKNGVADKLLASQTGMAIGSTGATGYNATSPLDVGPCPPGLYFVASLVHYTSSQPSVLLPTRCWMSTTFLVGVAPVSGTQSLTVGCRVGTATTGTTFPSTCTPSWFTSVGLSGYAPHCFVQVSL